MADDLAARLILIARTIIPFVLFMAWVYLALHVLFARFVDHRESPLLWFFSVVTGPLTRPVRLLLPVGTPESRVRHVALAVYVGLWVAVRVLFSVMSPPGRAG